MTLNEKKSLPVVNLDKYGVYTNHKKMTLSEKILSLRRYLWSENGMEYWLGDNDKNKGIYVDLGAVMGNFKEFIKKVEFRMLKKFGRASIPIMEIIKEEAGKELCVKQEQEE